MKRSSICPSVCPVIRPQPQSAEGFLLIDVRAGDIDPQRRRRGPSSSGATAWAATRRSAANASSVTLTADTGS